MTVGRIPSVEGGIQPTILDAKGDLIVATGNDSPNRLAVGANNLVLTADSAQATGVKWAAPDPLTTKGDLFTYSTTEARLGVGANDTVLTADSTAATGLKWATPSSGGMTLLSTTTLSGTSVTISSINQTYNQLLVIFSEVVFATATRIRVSANNSTNRAGGWDSTASGGNYSSTAFGTANYASQTAMLTINNYASTSARKIGMVAAGTTATTGAVTGSYFVDQTAAVTSLVIDTNSGAAFTSGTVLIYGVK